MANGQQQLDSHATAELLTTPRIVGEPRDWQAGFRELFLSAGKRYQARLREKIASTVSEVNDCRYCLAAHSATGRSIGLSEEVVRDSRRGESSDVREAAVSDVSRNVVRNRGWVTDEDMARLHRMKFTQGEIAEIISNIALTLFTNYFNYVAQTEADCPEVPELEARV